MPSRIRERPPLDLHAEITMPDGTTVRWHPSSDDPGNRPQGITFSTARMDGFKTGGCNLVRRIDQPQHDLKLFNTLRFIGAGGEIAWEGRVSALPRSTGTPATWNVQAVGKMANAKDRRFVMPILDRDLSQWQTPSFQRQNILLGLPRSLGEMNWQVVDGGLINAPPSQPVGAQALAEVNYTAPPNTLVSVVEYQCSASTNPAGWTLELRASDSADLTGGEGYTLTTDGAIHALSLTTPRRYLALQHYANGSAATPAVGTNIRFQKLAVYGLTGILTHGTSDDVDAVYAGEVIRWLIDTYCPELNSEGVQNTAHPIAVASFREPTFPYDAMLMMNGPHRWGLECWENGRVDYGPLNLDDYDWELRLDDFGTGLEVSGPTAEEVVNAIAVTYTDVKDGQVKRLTAQEYPDLLRDDSPVNPVNVAKGYRETEYTFSQPMSLDNALEWGRVALLEFNAPKHKGTATRQGYIQDRAGNWQPAWKVRAGDRIVITDSVDEEVHVIVETDYDHSSHTVRLAIDDTFQMLDAVMDRLSTALQARGL